MSCIFVEEAVASICGHLVGELLHIVLVGESFDFLLGRIVSVENICGFACGTGVHSILHQPPSQRSQSEEPED
jgi:hypothetical protein